MPPSRSLSVPGRRPGLRPPASPPRLPSPRITSSTTPRTLTLRVIAGARRYTAPAAAFAIGHQVGEALVPVVMGYGIDNAVRTGDVRALLITLGLLALTFGGLSYSFRLGSFLGEVGRQATQYQLRLAVVRRLLDPRGLAGRRHLPGEALSLATSDVQNLSTAVLLAVYPAGELAAVVFGGVVLFIISWPLGLIVFVGTPSVLLLMDRAGGSLVRRTEVEQQLAAEASAHATDLVTGYRVVKGIRAEAEAARRYAHLSQTALQGTLRARSASGRYRGITDASTAMIVAGVALAAGLLAVRGRITIGQLITVVGLTQLLITPISSFATNAGTVWAAARASAARLLPILGGQAALTGSEQPPEPDPDAPVLRVCVPGLPTVDLAGDEILALAVDARTADDLAELLAVRRQPAPGEYELFGRSVHDVDPAGVRGVLLVAPHVADLFEGSVLDNVALPGVEEAVARRALDLAAGGDLLAGLPFGVDTPVGEGGLQLSGGQRQRVALARALAVDAPVLVLCEPTSSIDSVTEAAVAEGIRLARAGRPTLLLTTSPALLAMADRVVNVPSVALSGGLPDIAVDGRWR
jgi:putative ABC transport system ATP-binding protein